MAAGRWHKAVAVADAVITHYVPTDVGDDCSPAVTEPEIYDDRPWGVVWCSASPRSAR
jgi:hypothetical protein